MCYKTKPDRVTDVCVGGGGGAAVSLCKLCLQLSSNKRENISTLVLATKSSSSLSEVIRLTRSPDKYTLLHMHSFTHTHTQTHTHTHFHRVQQHTRHEVPSSDSQCVVEQSWRTPLLK